ncbi:unnamed protein product [Amaranthus hypochondriacus]
MMSMIFSSFDPIWAESNGFKLVNFSPLNPSSSSTNSSSIDGVKKENNNCSSVKKQSEDLKSKTKLKKNPRFAPELDGVHCFETIVPY